MKLYHLVTNIIITTKIMTEHIDNTFWNYIVGVYAWDDNSMQYTFKTDGDLRIYENGTFIIENSNSVELVNGSFKNNSAYVLSNTKTVGSTFDVEIVTHANGKFGIRFDKSSSASHESFLKTYKKVQDSSVVIKYHVNGKIKIEGPQVDGVYNGMCVEYYNNSTNSVKYIGEIEDDEYDGSGEFFSPCGTIRLVVNNICSGTPNGIGRLFIAGRHIDNVKFSALEGKILYPKDELYCEQILKAIRSKDYYDIIEKGRFDLMTMDEKLSYIFKEITALKIKDRATIEKKTGGWSF